MFSLKSTNTSILPHVVCGLIYLLLEYITRMVVTSTNSNLKLLYLFAFVLLGIFAGGYIMFAVSLLDQTILIGYIGFAINLVILIYDIPKYYEYMTILHYLLSLNAIIYSCLVLFSLTIILTIDQNTGGIDENGVNILKIVAGSYVAFVFMGLLLTNRNN
jgi:hypothetical protein